LIRCQCKFGMLLHEAINVTVEFPHCLPMAPAGKRMGSSGATKRSWPMIICHSCWLNRARG
jgi:hypothetical protein